MTWLTKIRTYLGQDEIASVPPNEEDSLEAKKALEDAQVALTEARQRREQVREVTESLAILRARNHFGESIELAMMRKGSSR